MIGLHPQMHLLCEIAEFLDVAPAVCHTRILCSATVSLVELAMPLKPCKQLLPDHRSRYMPADCKDQETTYPRWIVETWERLPSEHSKNEKALANAVISQQLWFEDLPAVMRMRITTANVLKVLRKRNPEVATPCNFVLSPILIQPSADCTLIAPASKHPEEWLTREIHRDS